MLITFIVGALTLLVVLDYLHKKHRVDAFAKSRINGPTALPIFGCGLAAVRVGAENMIQWIGECFKKYGKTFRLWILYEAAVYTIDIKHFETVLSSTTLLQKGDLYDLLRFWLRDGLLLSVGRKWHARRKVFTPAFHFSMLEHYVDVFDRHSAVMVQQLKQYADGQTPVEVFSKVCLAALDSVLEAAMGVKMNAQLDQDFPYLKALKSVVYIQANRMFKFNQRFDWLFKLTAPGEYREMLHGIKVMHDFTIKVIEERRANLDQSIADGTYKPLHIGDHEIESKVQMALLDILLQSTIDGKPLSNEDICEEVDTFMFEGDDTTTSGVSHTLYCISRHPEVQQKLFAEILDVIGKDKDAPINMKQLQQLKYMEYVIKETLRLHPPVPAVGRKIDQDIEIDGAIIPANTSIYLVTIYAHRDPENFPNPDAFIPERFEEMAESKDKRNAFIYTPFSAGPRNCIGQKFAMLEMKSLISKTLRYYELLPLGPELEPMMNFILRSSKGVHIGLKPRVY